MLSRCIKNKQTKEGEEGDGIYLTPITDRPTKVSRRTDRPRLRAGIYLTPITRPPPFITYPDTLARIHYINSVRRTLSARQTIF